MEKKGDLINSILSKKEAVHLEKKKIEVHLQNSEFSGFQLRKMILETLQSIYENHCHGVQ